MNVTKRLAHIVVGVLLGCGTATAAPFHYIVFQVDAAGEAHPYFYAQVDLKVQATGPSKTRVNAFDPASIDNAGSDGITYELGRDGTSLGTYRVNVPQLRGEFARDPGRDGSIVSAMIPAQSTRAFVLRVPVGEADTITLDTGVGRQSFRLDALKSMSTIAPTTPDSQPQVQTTGASGSPANRVDILVLGDGYTAAQHGAFNADAATLHDAFFNKSPYLEYGNFVNWSAGFVASNQSGADHPPYLVGCSTDTCCADPTAEDDPSSGQFVNTAFDARFCSFQTQRLLTIDNSKVLAAAAAYPDWDKLIVLVNDLEYGGSGGSVSVASLNEFASEILFHEYGHSFTHLADEYDTPYPGYPPCSDVSGAGSPPCEANVTNVTQTAQIKWNSLLTPGNPIPTPVGTTGVGLFEGARYQSFGMYRPVDEQCEMRFLEQPFCPVCRQAYILTLYRGGWGTPSAGIDLIEPGSESPSPAQVVGYGLGSTLTFQATLLRPDIGSVDVQWWLDGNLLSSTTANSNLVSYVFQQNVPTPSTRTLELRVIDTTSLVSPAMNEGLTTHNRVWTIEVGLDLIFKNGFE